MRRNKGSESVKNLLIFAAVMTLTLIVFFIVFKKNINPETTNNQEITQDVKQSLGNKNDQAQADLGTKLDIIRGTVAMISQNKLTIKTESGEKEITINDATPIYQAVNKQISPSNFKQIKKNAKVSVQYWKEASVATSILIEK